MALQDCLSFLCLLSHFHSLQGRQQISTVYCHIVVTFYIGYNNLKTNQNIAGYGLTAQ